MLEVKEELKTNTIYIHKNSKAIVLWAESVYKHYIGGISGKNQSRYCFGDGHFDNIGAQYILANSFEIHWLKCCIKANEFIPKEQAMKSFKSKNYEVYC